MLSNMISRILSLLEDSGEVQLYMDSGAAFEIHGDAELDDGELVFEDDDGEMFYLDAEKVEYVSVHRSHRASPA